jgi:hypothetical protein
MIRADGGEKPGIVARRVALAGVEHSRCWVSNDLEKMMIYGVDFTPD